MSLPKSGQEIQLFAGGLFVGPAVVVLTEFDLFAALFDAPFVGVPERVGAAAVFLHIELLVLADLEHPGGAAFFAPVVGPIGEAFVVGGGADTAIVYLVKVFPTGDAERTADEVKAIFVGVQRGPFEAHVEAHRTADAAFRFHFHAFCAGKPVVHIVVGIDEGDVVFFRKTDILVLPQIIFLLGMDIRVVKEDGEIDAGGNDGFHYFTGAGCAAGMQ